MRVPSQKDTHGFKVSINAYDMSTRAWPLDAVLIASTAREHSPGYAR
jgi:hypothetical protein